jgi:hypothetical protein
MDTNKKEIMKDEAKAIILNIFGPLSAQKVDSFDDSNPKAFLDKCRTIISDTLGDAEGNKLFEPLYKKYS